MTQPQSAPTPRTKLDRMRPRDYVAPPNVPPRAPLQQLAESTKPHTRQGVRDLNGPSMRGFGYNGRAASCSHYRDPQSQPVVIRAELALGIGGHPISVRKIHCLACHAFIAYADEE